MNIEITDLDMILNYLETTSLEPHDNYSSEFTYKDQKILYKYIKQLQQENKILKENAENNDKVIDKVNWKNMLLKKENQQLKNDINKLQKELNEENLQCSKYSIEFNNLKEKNKQLKDKLSKIETLIINHNCDTGDIYYKYNSRFLKSELKQRILEIVYEEGSDSNENNNI